MIDLIIVSCSIVLLMYSLALCNRFDKKIEQSSEEKPTLTIVVLVYLFIFGYIAFLLQLITAPGTHGAHELLVSIIFFFGAVFVVIILSSNYKLMFKLIDISTNLRKFNNELENKNKELRDKTEDLNASENKYKKRTKELEETLDNFYTMRIGMMEQLKKGTVEKENNKIKKRLKEIKNDL